MKLLLTATAIALSLNAFAVSDLCTVSPKDQDSSVNWTAFKTPKKVGVKGSFKTFKITTKKSVTVDELIAGATFEIDTHSTSTGDKARDAKVFNFFFKSMTKGSKITGKVLKVTADKVETELTFNGTTKTVSLMKKVDEAKSIITLNGAINVLEFGMKSNLEALTKACNTLHEGVTWPNVEIELVEHYTKSCK